MEKEGKERLLKFCYCQIVVVFILLLLLNYKILYYSISCLKAMIASNIYD